MVPYGGFWWRVLAAIIDGIVLQIAWSVISGVLGFGWMSESYMTDFSGGRAMGASFYQPAGISLVTNWLYYALMESSKFQATVGKLAVGLVVTDLEGNRISFLRATGRYFAKILSAMIMLIGYIMVAFTARKQGLHDMLASTLVYKTRDPRELETGADVFA